MGEWDWTADELLEALEDATVNVLCAPEDRARVAGWVDTLEHRHLVRVRTSMFLRRGQALCWQLDGVLAPRTPRLVSVAALET